MTALIPTRDELGPNDVLVHIPADARPDNFGRVQFTAFWLDDYLPPNGVRGQVFHADPEKFAAGIERRGEKVRSWSPEEGVL